ncbi:MAG: hypothetical protein HY288_08910 [Planctomycetia bacterium]|nr:hypothetical protein [Planctomycetia bacterium]
MWFRSWRWFCLVAWMLAAHTDALATNARAEQRTVANSTSQLVLDDGDRVVDLGSTFIERDLAHGYFETALTGRFDQHRIQFRNLGWRSDNVLGEARAGFGSVADGFEQVKKHALALAPALILVNYEAKASFAGWAGPESFLSGLNWATGYSQASGSLPLVSIPILDSKRQGGDKRMVRSQLDVATAGKVGLLAGGPIEKLWLERAPAASGSMLAVDLPAGVHTISLLLGAKSAEDLRLELTDVPGSAAQVQIVGGK